MKSDTGPELGQKRDVRRKEIVRFLHSVGKVSDQISFHAFVFAAQKQSLLSTQYRFEFSRNIPLSTELSWDLEELIRDRKICDTHTSNTIFVNEDASKNLKKMKAPLVSVLSGADAAVVITLSRLIWLTKDKGITLEAAKRQLIEQDLVKAEFVDKAVTIYSSHF